MMNSTAILALMGDLYTQNDYLGEQVEQLSGQVGSLTAQNLELAAQIELLTKPSEPTPAP